MFTVEQTCPKPPEISLAIVGGGIAGLALALSVTRHAPQMNLVLYESAAKFGEIGAGVGFMPNAVRAMAKIDPKLHDAFDRVRNENVMKKDLCFFHGVGMDGKDDQARSRGVRDGNLILEALFGESIRGWGSGGVHRAVFVDEMLKILPSTVNVELKKRLADVKDLVDHGVVLTFTDGSERRHAAVVGCDGVRSRTPGCALGRKRSGFLSSF